MSILSNPINDSAVRENALAQLISDNVWSHKKPHIGYWTNNSLIWKSDIISVEDNTLMFNKKRTTVTGIFDWDKYGIDSITGQVIMFEDAQNALPKNLFADLIYFRDNYRRFENMRITSTQVKFVNWWIGTDGGLYNVNFDCASIDFSDPPKVFENVTGKCGRIVFKCMDFADVPGLCYAVIKQTVNGKKIQRLKDIRAYFNNPRKYPSEDPAIFFNVEEFIKHSGLDKLEGLHSIAIRDSGILFNFNKLANRWICTHIERL